MFAAKLMWNQLPELEQHAAKLPDFAGLPGAELLDALFGRPSYVWMRPRDKMRQAISLWRALQTRTWRLEHPGEDACSPSLSYSFEGIEHLRRRLTADDEAWGRYFLHSLIAPLELVYEDDVGPDSAAPSHGSWRTAASRRLPLGARRADGPPVGRAERRVVRRLPSRCHRFAPGEGRNYIGNDDYADVLADLRERLEAWMVSTGDPLLNGPVAPPVGARINSQSQRSADEPTQVVEEINAPAAK